VYTLEKVLRLKKDGPATFLDEVMKVSCFTVAQDQADIRADAGRQAKLQLLDDLGKSLRDADEGGCQM
jgi:hypothetical protein